MTPGPPRVPVSSMIPVGELIWVSVQPLIRLYAQLVHCTFPAWLITFCETDFYVSQPALPSPKRGYYPLWQLAVPGKCCSIVPAFSSSNVGALGPLVFVALLYEAIGIAISWIIKQVFWVPHRFRYGILVAGGWANVGDIPTSVVMSLTAAAPFNGTSDQDLAVAYIAVFTLMFCITLFPLGGVHWVAMDFRGPDVIDEDVQEQLKTKQKYLGAAIERVVISLKGLFYLRRPQAESGNYDDEKVVAPAHRPSEPSIPSLCPHDEPPSPGTTIVQHAAETVETKSEPVVPLRHRLTQFVSSFVQTLIMPCSFSIILAFIVSLVPALKALFVPDVPGINMPSAPDGQPPLAIILNTTTFIGNASVPLGLMTLGSALARMEVPGGRLRSLPLGAVGALASWADGRDAHSWRTHYPRINPSGVVGRQRQRFTIRVHLPVLFTNGNDPGKRSRSVFLTQVYSGTGNAQHLSVFLIPQYILMFITMTALTAYTLHLLFG
ncbi:membrane transport protein-domain-containing protein [Butyriboletus roseoflavus]|nr:membrane transport protein-domain-containing protein [Butyriboletus roseoflavus]